MIPSQFTVSPRAARERLDVYLAKTLDRPRSRIQRLLKSGSVKVNGQTERPSYLTQAGDIIDVNEPEPATAAATPPQLTIIFEDDDLLVIDKPAGLAVHPGAGTNAGKASTVADFARLHTTDPDPDRPGIVHRLDRDTSGLLVLAKTVEAKTSLQAAFKAHLIQKTYRLLVVGRLPHDEAVINLPLGRHPAKPLRQAVVGGGRQSSTGYRTVTSYSGYTLAEAQPKSGRTHQLRVHFAAIGHPVAGDVTYGPPHRPLGLKRQFLHAAGLSFTTPSDAVLELVSPLPSDLEVVIRKLEAAEAKTR